MQLSNQLTEGVEKGMLDPKSLGTVIPAQAVSGLTDPLYPGMAVMLTNDSGKMIQVNEQFASVMPPFGVIVYDAKKNSYDSQEVMEIASGGSMVWVEAGAAFSRGVQLTYDATNKNYIAATTGVSIVGIALDNAAAEGDLIRLLVKDPCNHALMP